MTDLKPGEAQICFHNDVYRVFVADGFFAKEVWISRTEQDALDFCKRKNLKVIR